jgi:hypothetical protein
MRLSSSFAFLLLFALVASSFVYLASYCQGQTSDAVDAYDERYDEHVGGQAEAIDWGTRTSKNDMVLAVVSRYDAKKISEWWLDSLKTTTFDGRIVVLHDGSLSSSDSAKLEAKGVEVVMHTDNEYGHPLDTNKEKLKSTSVRAFAVSRFWMTYTVCSNFCCYGTC